MDALHNFFLAITKEQHYNSITEWMTFRMIHYALHKDEYLHKNQCLEFIMSFNLTLDFH